MTPLPFLLLHLLGWPLIAFTMLHHAAVNARTVERVQAFTTGLMQ